MQRDLATVGFIFILDMKGVAYWFLLSQQLVISCKIHSVPWKYSLYCFAVDFVSHIITFLNTCWTPVAAHTPLSMTVEAENRERLFWSCGYLSDCLTAFEKFSPDTLHASLLSHWRPARLGNKAWPAKALRCHWCASSESYDQQKSISLTCDTHTHANLRFSLPPGKSENTEWGNQLSGQTAATSSVTKHMFVFLVLLRWPEAGGWVSWNIIHLSVFYKMKDGAQTLRTR